MASAHANHVAQTWWQADYIVESLGRTHTWVAHDGDVMVGTATLGRRGDDWVLWKLYVSPHAQRGGLGAALLQTAVEAVPPGTRGLLLSYIAGNRHAAAFYARQGFEHVSTEADPDSWPDQVWLRLPLPR